MASLVSWHELAPDQIEGLVAAWIVKEYPQAYRVDGSGGDDGADVVRPVEGGIHVFEVKSFRERLTPSHRRQVLDSLRTALDKQPAMIRWTLVLPRDLTPAEIRWFASDVRPLAGAVICDWIGLTQLEAGLSSHRSLLQTIPGSAERRALEMVRELGLAPSGPSSAQLPQAAVGEGADDLQDEFEVAFEAAGGHPALGAPIGPVATAGPGLAQAFPAAADGSGAVICVLPGHPGAVVPAAIWLALRRYAGGAARGGGLDRTGVPVGTDSESLVIAADAVRVSLFEGAWWHAGELLRVSVEAPWVWQPVTTVDFEGPNRREWSASMSPPDLRLRVVAHLPWPGLSGDSLTRARRERLKSALAGSEFDNVAAVLTMRRGAPAAVTDWTVATGHDGFHTDRSVHLRSELLAPDGRAALVNDVMLAVPNQRRPDHVLACASVSVNVDAWLAVLAAQGAAPVAPEHVLLSLAELVESLASAWGTVLDVVPLGALDDPTAAVLYGAPKVELQLFARSLVATGHQTRTLADLIDLSPFGPASRTEQHFETGFRVITPLTVDRASRHRRIAEGLVTLARSWGHAEADTEAVLNVLNPPQRPLLSAAGAAGQRRGGA